jgi:hypothetical protein
MPWNYTNVRKTTITAIANVRRIAINGTEIDLHWPAVPSRPWSQSSVGMCSVGGADRVAPGLGSRESGQGRPGCGSASDGRRGRDTPELTEVLPGCGSIIGRSGGRVVGWSARSSQSWALVVPVGNGAAAWYASSRCRKPAFGSPGEVLTRALSRSDTGHEIFCAQTCGLG